MVTVNYTLGHCSSEYGMWQVMMFLVIVPVSKSINLSYQNGMFYIQNTI
jgi:hypothetical protein